MSATLEGQGYNGSDTFSDATMRTLFSETIPENSAGFRVIRVTARRVSDGAAKVFFLELGVKRSTGNVEVFGLQLLASKATVGDAITLAAVSATVDASGSDIRIRVAGLASTEIDWAFTNSGEVVIHE